MSTSLRTHRVDVVEPGGSVRRGRVRCEIDEHLKFDAKGLATYCLTDWDTTVYDAFVVAAAVQFCDHTARRSSTGWGRDMALRVPVHDPDRWGSPDVSRALHDALAFLTGDRWRMDFAARRGCSVTTPGPLLEIDDSPCVVMPFSDGLDSYVAARLLRLRSRDTLIPVRLGRKSGNAERVGNSRTSAAFASMPWRVSYGNSGSVEVSARSRGFRFALLSGVAAFLCKAREVVVPESGQGALGPPLAPVGQAYADYRNHPRFTEKMEAFVSALFGHAVRYSYPHLWQTKGKTLAAFLDACGDDRGWMETRSCWQGARQVSVAGRRRQCGICVACLLRRMSVHAARRCEDPETYVWEDLSAACFEDGAAQAFTNRKPSGAMYEHAIAGVLHLDHLAALGRSPAKGATFRRQAFFLSRSLGSNEEETQASLQRMLRRHGEEWREFVDSLGPRSFVAQWIARGH